jgi:hypothetical protein
MVEIKELMLLHQAEAVTDVVFQAHQDQLVLPVVPAKMANPEPLEFPEPQEDHPHCLVNRSLHPLANLAHKGRRDRLEHPDNLAMLDHPEHQVDQEMTPPQENQDQRDLQDHLGKLDLKDQLVNQEPQQ